MRDPMRDELNLQNPCFTVGEIDVVNASREKNYRHSYRNGRLKHGFIYTVSGEMCNTLLDSVPQDIHVRAGELIFIPKGTRYIGTYCGENTEIKVVHFNLLSGELPDYLSSPIKIALPDAENEINAFFALKPRRNEKHPFYFLACLYHLLWRIEENREDVPTKYSQLHAALSDMREYPELDRSIADYAELCRMSEINFRRLFKQYTGMPPIAYRNDIRLQSAHTKLQSGEYNVSEAAESAGFSNLSFFIRQYKKKFGHTPTRK